MPELLLAIWDTVRTWLIGGFLTACYTAAVLVLFYVLALPVVGIRGLLARRKKGGV